MLNQNATPIGTKQAELPYIINRLEGESSRFFNLVNTLISKGDFISHMSLGEQEPNNKTEAEPTDFVSKAHYEINNIAKQNDKLQTLVNHFETLV